MKTCGTAGLFPGPAAVILRGGTIRGRVSRAPGLETGRVADFQYVPLIDS